MLETKLLKHVEELMLRYPKLVTVKKDIINAYLILEECYLNDKKLLIAGNGGPAQLILSILQEN